MLYPTLLFPVHAALCWIFIRGFSSCCWWCEAEAHTPEVSACWVHLWCKLVFCFFWGSASCFLNQMPTLLRHPCQMSVDLLQLELTSLEFTFIWFLTVLRDEQLQEAAACCRISQPAAWASGSAALFVFIPLLCAEWFTPLRLSACWLDRKPWNTQCHGQESELLWERTRSAANVRGEIQKRLRTNVWLHQQFITSHLSSYLGLN